LTEQAVRAPNPRASSAGVADGGTVAGTRPDSGSPVHAAVTRSATNRPSTLRPKDMGGASKPERSRRGKGVKACL
jgi:hypothetical protein